MASLHSVRSTVVVLAALTAAVSLAGCGGNRSDPGNAYKPKAGDPLYSSVQVDGVPVLEETYRYYGVDDEGNLSATPVANDEERPHVALLETTTARPSGSVRFLVANESLPLGTVMAFYKELWAAQKALHPGYAGQDLAVEIGELDGGIEDLYRDVQASGLSTADYIAFYDVATAAWPEDEDVAGQARDFLASVMVSPGDMVGILNGMGWSWSGLVSRMVAQRTSFDDLYDAFEDSSFDTLETFLASYLGATPSQAPRFEAAAGASGLDVAKFAWEIIQDGRPVTETSGALTRVLSERDTSWEHYAGATRGETKIVEWEAKNLFGMTLFKARFHLAGYYGATNPGFGGKWLPSVAFSVDEAYTFWTWWLNASATVLHAVNAGSVDEPVPQIEMEAKVRVNGWFQSQTKTFRFLANGNTGFSAL